MEKLNRTLQENLLALICFNDEYGKIVSNQIDANLFEGDYREIAEKAIQYWRNYSQAPKDHTADLFSHILDNPDNKRAPTFRRIIAAMIDLSDNINTTYVMSQLTTFIRMQKFKSAVLTSAEKLNANQERSVQEIEDIWNDLLKVRETNFDAGMKLTDVDRLLNYFEKQSHEFSSGIEDLDKRNIIPARGKVTLFLAPAGFGKTWALVNYSKRALMLRKKVVFISLEMDEEEIIQRHFQSFFSVTKRSFPETIMTMEFNSLDKLEGLGTEEVKGTFAFDSPLIREELNSHIIHHESRIKNLIVKRFPPRSVNVRQINAYLDNLELVEKFIPDMIILDYIGRIKTDVKNHRLNLGTEFEEFRGLCIERNIAGVTAHQVSKAGMEASVVQSTHIAEDFSFIHTADTVLTYSTTKAERKFGLARIFVSKARSEQGNFGVLITQSYGLGQFCLNSTLLTPKYFDKLKEIDDEDEPYDNSEDTEED